MKPSSEFCEMIKAAYNNEISNVDFYTRMAQLAPNDQICRAFVQMSRDVLKHSFYLDSICSLTSELVETSNGGGCSTPTYPLIPPMQLAPVQMPPVSYQEPVPAPMYTLDQIPMAPIEQAPADTMSPAPVQLAPEPAYPSMPVPDTMVSPAPMTMPSMPMMPPMEHNLSCPPCNQTVNLYTVPGMDYGYGTFTMPAPSMPDFVIPPMPNQPAKNNNCSPCQKKVCAQDSEETVSSESEDNLSTEGKNSPCTIPMPKCCDKPSTTAKEAYKNTINSYKYGKRV